MGKKRSAKEKNARKLIVQRRITVSFFTINLILNKIALFNDIYGKDPKKTLKMKKVPKRKYKMADYVKALNYCRVNPKGCWNRCKKILSDPLIGGKNCRLSHQFIEGTKGVRRLESFFKERKVTHLKPFSFDPCLSVAEYQHAKYMSEGSCLTHNELSMYIFIYSF